jgi:hypothetical protein
MSSPVPYNAGVNDSQAAPTSIGRKSGNNTILHPSWLNQLPSLLVFFVLELLVIYVRIEFSDRSANKLPDGALDTIILMLPVFPLIVLAKAAHTIFNERLVITPHYIIHVMGRISWRVRSVRLEYQHIQEIEIQQTILQRVLGIGDISIVALGGANVAAVHMHGLANPRAVKDLIRDMRVRASVAER